jgi:hypothetical protein
MRGQSKNRRRRWQPQRGRQPQRRRIAEKRLDAKAREERLPPPPKLSAAQRDFLRKAKRRVRELFVELTDEIIALIHEEVGR